MFCLKNKLKIFKDWLPTYYYDDVKAGYEQLKSAGVYHRDLHVGNVMYDPKTDNYNIIDIT